MNTLDTICTDPLLNEALINNLTEFDKVVTQYINISNIVLELIDRIICKEMINENYQKVNILLNELNRLLLHYYLQYHVTITSNIDDLIKFKVSDLDTIVYTTITGNLVVIDDTSATLTITINEVATTYTVIIGQKITIEFFDLTILKIAETNFTIKVNENKLLVLFSTYNILQELKLYLIDLDEIPVLEDNYDQSISIKNITTIKEKLECYKQYLVEKLDLICKYKNQYRNHTHSNHTHSNHIHGNTHSHNNTHNHHTPCN